MTLLRPDGACGKCTPCLAGKFNLCEHELCAACGRPRGAHEDPSRFVRLERPLADTLETRCQHAGAAREGTALFECEIPAPECQRRMRMQLCSVCWVELLEFVHVLITRTDDELRILIQDQRRELEDVIAGQLMRVRHLIDRGEPDRACNPLAAAFGNLEQLAERSLGESDPDDVPPATGERLQVHVAPGRVEDEARQRAFAPHLAYAYGLLGQAAECVPRIHPLVMILGLPDVQRGIKSVMVANVPPTTSRRVLVSMLRRIDEGAATLVEGPL